MNKKYNQLLTQINKKRKEMIEVGMVNGLTSLETVKCSQELDDLLNLYQDFKNKNYFSEIAV